jgi:hypothetical protein
LYVPDTPTKWVVNLLRISEWVGRREFGRRTHQLNFKVG